MQFIQMIVTKIIAWLYSAFSKSNSQNGKGLADSLIRMVNKPAKTTVEILKDLYAKHGGKWSGEMNIFGIRVSDNPLSDKFDDYIGIAFFDHPSQSWQWRMYKGTTDPGLMWITNKSVNRGRGASFMALGPQEDIWIIGAHRGSRHADGSQFVVDPALIAIGAQQRSFHDSDHDGKQSGEKEHIAWEDLNCHCASFYYTGKASELIGPFSAGCQVIETRKDWLEFINYIVSTKRFKEKPKCKWSYMLFSKEQMPAEFWVSR